MKQKLAKKMMALGLTFGMLLGSFGSGVSGTTAYAAEEEPILTIACLSDLHNQMSLLECSVENVRMRGVVNDTLQAIKAEENIDMMILCGDYTSDSTNIPEENWKRIRELMVNATRDAFPDDAEKTPVLWVDGNHDYEITRDYNAGDYYSFPMKEDIGELPAEDSFYERTYDNRYDLLAAFYYKLYGFDFLCLNTGNFIFDNPNGSGNYTGYKYSMESVQWIEQKLEKIYADNPNKTVFFVTHIPFDDSNSINKGKGLDENAESTKLLKKTLAKYPNLIHLYGHDHGKDSAYVRSDTAQRVTQYDTEGNKMQKETSSPVWDVQKTANGYSIKNSISGKYLGYADSNVAFLDEAQDCDFVHISGNKYEVKLPTTERPYLYFSTSSKTFSANKESCELEVYEKTEEKEGTIRFVPAETIEDGKQYAIAKTSGDKVYVVTNQTNGSTGTSLRLTPSTAESKDGGLEYKSGSTGTPSFITSFVGSMRYYSNSIDGPSSPNDSKVVQAMMVYVYKDRVELQMKNYGKYMYYDQPYPGNISIVISRYLKPYVISRTVINNYADNSELTQLVEEMKTISLEGYTASTIRAFNKALEQAQDLLKETLDSSEKEKLDEAAAQLREAKENLKKKPNDRHETLETRAEETDKETKKQPETKTDVQPGTEANQKPQPQITLKKPVLKAKVSKKKVKLSWKKVANAKSYQIQIKSGKGKYKLLKQISGNKKTTVTVKNLKKGTYSLRMRACAGEVKGTYSKVVKVKIK